MATGQARPAGERPDGTPFLVVGEVVTALVQHSTPLTNPACQEILRIRPGSTVRAATRPTPFAVSPATAVGVHCTLPTASGARVEGVGTVVAQATVTGGRLVQTSARAVLSARAFDYRAPWSYYLANPGLIEVRGRTDIDDLVRGCVSFVDGEAASSLDLGAVCTRLLDRVQRSPLLDRRRVLRAPRTRLRWVAVYSPAARLAGGMPSGTVSPSAGESPPSVELVIHDDVTRSLVIGPTGAGDDRLGLLAEDVARHDWLLSTLLRFVDDQRSSAHVDGAGGHAVASLVDLFHLWMPGALVPAELATVWPELEAGPAFSRQWVNLVGHVRDQIALAGVTPTPPARRIPVMEPRLS